MTPQDLFRAVRGSRAAGRLKPGALALALTALAPAVPVLAAPPARAAGHKASVEWITIPGGSFLMGAGDVGADAAPHRVAVRTFQLARTEVTRAQYKTCVDAGACAVPVCDWPPARGEGTLPVTCVDWDGANKFSAWAGGRLPSEAEWEYAARGAGGARQYPWGDRNPDCSLAVLAGCGAGPAPACSKPAGNTPQGLCDMAGNVWEWVRDWYHGSYDGAPADGSAWEVPAGPYRVNRGGSWGTGPDLARSAYRRIPGRPGGDLGFRPAKDR